MYYDKITEMLIINLYSLNLNDDAIYLCGLDLKNKEHQWVLNTAITCLGTVAFADKKARLKTTNNFFDRLRIWIKNRKYINYVHRADMSDSEHSISDMLEFMRPAAAEIAGQSTFDFGEILDYYERELI